MLIRCCFLVLFWLLTTVTLRAQTPVEWTTNHAPFRIVGNLYYVGSNDLAAYLLTTPRGNILLNGNLASSVPQIRLNIEALGFRLADTKILLISQAHFDHVGGTAELKRLTGAQLAVMDADVSVMESGGRDDFAYYNRPELQFAPTKVDRTLHDGDQVKLGGTALTAHLTAGHTKGTTTWTLDVAEAGRTYRVLIFGGATANEGNNLINDPRYPQQAADFERTFATLRTLPCDIFLGTHGVYFQLPEKYPRLQPNQPSPFLDPAGYQAYVADREQAFRAELAKQTAAQRK
jgi:metallo-beta-lactamase class B